MNTTTNTRQTRSTPGQMATIPAETLLMCQHLLVGTIGQIDRSLLAAGVPPAELAHWGNLPLHVPGTSGSGASDTSGTPPRARTGRQTNTAASSTNVSQQPDTANTQAKGTSPINTYIQEAVVAHPQGCMREEIETFIRNAHPDYKFDANILSMNLKRQWTGKQIQAVGQVKGKGATPRYYPLTVKVPGATTGVGFGNRTRAAA